MRNKIMVVIISIIVVSFCAGMAIGTATATELKAIGKANIKKGTVLPGVMLIEAIPMSFTYVAYEDFTVYITNKIKPLPGTHNGGYSADAGGFPHACPAHGKEVADAGMIVIAQEMVDDGTVEVTLFEKAAPSAGD